MTVLLENYLPVVQYNGLNTNKLVNVAASTGLVAGGSTVPAIAIGTAAGPNIYFGSGAPSITAPAGSLYLRSDGSTGTTRAYINTTGSTTWTAINTVA
jgi:hypothetical protein